MWSNEQMTPESSVSQYNLPCEQMFETSLTGEPNRIIRPALAGRCGPFPTGANRESPSGHRERSRPHGAPPLRRAPPPQSWSPVDPAAGPEPGCAHRHGRRPPPRVARTPVHAQKTTSASTFFQPRDQGEQPRKHGMAPGPYGPDATLILDNPQANPNQYRAEIQPGRFTTAGQQQADWICQSTILEFTPGSIPGSRQPYAGSGEHPDLGPRRWS